MVPEVVVGVCVQSRGGEGAMLASGRSRGGRGGSGGRRMRSWGEWGGGEVRVGAGAPCGEGTRKRIDHRTLRRGPTRKYQSNLLYHGFIAHNDKKNSCDNVQQLNCLFSSTTKYVVIRTSGKEQKDHNNSQEKQAMSSRPSHIIFSELRQLVCLKSHYFCVT